jgi:glycosyltransferase involved in cell wall biosynthesis
MSKKLLFAVHRYAPFPGGSENYVRDMAECCVRLGHDVTVFAGQHGGDLNGVKVTSDGNIITENFDLIVVHGAGVGLQDFVLGNADWIPSPVLYMVILPQEIQGAYAGLRNAKFIGCSTEEDWEFAAKYGMSNKAKKVIHGIDKNISIGKPGFKEKYNITASRMFLSCGGYWSNKAMKELADLFNRLDIPDAVLVTTGYDNRSNLMPERTDKVIPLLIEDRNDVLSAIVEADLYVMHSFVEGFGLVLLESMLNKTQWAARYGSGARLLKNYGFTYNNDEELAQYLLNFNSDSDKIENAFSYVNKYHMIENTVNDILRLL